MYSVQHPGNNTNMCYGKKPTKKRIIELTNEPVIEIYKEAVEAEYDLSMAIELEELAEEHGNEEQQEFAAGVVRRVVNYNEDVIGRLYKRQGIFPGIDVMGTWRERMERFPDSKEMCPGSWDFEIVDPTTGKEATYEQIFD